METERTTKGSPGQEGADFFVQETRNPGKLVPVVGEMIHEMRYF